MGEAFITRRGGGGGGSELTIVGGTTRPANATQNTIWVNTDVDITSYILSTTEPESPVAGMVWITIKNSGAVKIASPVGGDWITVYLLYAKQYISGAWVDKTAKNYQNGDWVDWIIYWVKDGTPSVVFVNSGYKTISQGNSSSNTILNVSKLQIDSHGTDTYIIEFSEKFNAQNRNKVCISGQTQLANNSASTATSATITFFVVDESGNSLASASVSPTTKGSYQDFNAIIDLSNVTCENAKVRFKCVRNGNYASSTKITEFVLQ